MKFDEVVTSFGFKENIVDQCIYLKMLSKACEIKDLSQASFVLGVEIIETGLMDYLGLFQKAYIDGVLKV